MNRNEMNLEDLLKLRGHFDKIQSMFNLPQIKYCNILPSNKTKLTQVSWFLRENLDLISNILSDTILDSLNSYSVSSIVHILAQRNDLQTSILRPEKGNILFFIPLLGYKNNRKEDKFDILNLLNSNEDLNSYKPISNMSVLRGLNVAKPVYRTPLKEPQTLISEAAE